MARTADDVVDSKKMAGNQSGKNSDDPDNQGQRCGKNHTGHIYKCACCLENCPPLHPDNCTLIPVCRACWLKIGANNRLLIVSFFKNTQAIEDLTGMIQEALSHQGIVAGRMKPSADQN